MLKRTLSVVITVLAIAVATSALAEEAKPGPTSRPAAPAKKATPGQALSRTVDELKFDQEPFDECINHLRDLWGTNILVNYRTLDQAGVKMHTPVSMEVHKMRGDQVLKTLLRATSSEVALDYMVEGGSITISTKKEIDAMKSFSGGRMRTR